MAATAKTLSADPDVAVVHTPFTPKGTDQTLIAKDGDSAIAIANLKPGNEEGESADRLITKFEGNENVTLGGGQIAQHEVSTTVEKDCSARKCSPSPCFSCSACLFSAD